MYYKCTRQLDFFFAAKCKTGQQIARFFFIYKQVAIFSYSNTNVNKVIDVVMDFLYKFHKMWEVGTRVASTIRRMARN